MNSLADWLRGPAAHALDWALLNFLWEGAALALLLAGLLHLLRNASARARYAAGALVLLAMPIAFGVTFAVSLPHPQTIVPMPVDAVVLRTVSHSLSYVPARFRGPMLLMGPLWLLGVVFFYARGLAGWWTAQRLRRRGVCVPPSEWQQRLDSLRVRMRVSRPVALLESCITDVPVLIGYLRPAILIPVGYLAGLSVEQVECILIHELAHVRRADYLVNLLQSCVAGLLFYHPAVWWTCRVVRAERENCCDDVVVEMEGDARAYAATLATLEHRRAPATEAALAASGGNLMNRIRRLLRQPHGSSMAASAPFAGVVLLLSLATALIGWPPAPQSRGVAQSGPDSPRVFVSDSARRVTVIVDRPDGASSASGEARAAATNRFLEDEVKRRQEIVRAKESEFARFQAENADRLPENFQANLMEVNRLQGAIASLRTGLSLDQQKLVLAESTLQNLKTQQAQKDSELAGVINKITEYNALLAAAKQKYPDTMPEIGILKGQIQKLQDERDRLEKANEFHVQAADLLASQRALQARVSVDAADMQNDERRLADAEKQLQEVQGRIAGGPAVIARYNTLVHELAIAKSQYEDLARKQDLAAMAQRLEAGFSAPRPVTILVALDSAPVHVSGSITAAGRQQIQSFDADSSGQPALARLLPLAPGSYHLAVAIKNAATGATRNSEVNFTVE